MFLLNSLNVDRFLAQFSTTKYFTLQRILTQYIYFLGEKPFECGFCSKQFRQSSTLNNHIKVHASEKFDTGISSDVTQCLDDVAVLKVESEYTN